MKIRAWDAVFLIVIMAFALRIFFAMQTMQYSDYDSYYGLRQIESIGESGKHISYDELSYGGRDVLGIPFSYYIMSFFHGLFGNVALKIMPALFISLLAVVVYLIAKKISENTIAACLAALCSAFIPILVLNTLNSLKPYSIAYPLFFLAAYLFLRMNENKAFLIAFVIASFVMPLTHPIAFILAISMMIYAVLAYVESIELDIIKKEGMLLFIMVTFLIEFMLYKKAFINLGINAIWQNIPKSLMSDFFKDINILSLMVDIGIVPLLFGIIGIYFGLKNKNKDVLLLASIGISSIMMLILKLVEVSIGLVSLGITLSLASAMGFDKLFKYIAITKFSGHIKAIKASLLVFITLTLIVPSIIGAVGISDETLKEDEIGPFLWINNKTALSATVMAGLEEGNLVTGIGKRKSAYDMNFMFVDDAEKRNEELSSLFTIESEVKAIEIIKRYDIDYIYISEKTKKRYGIDELKYAVDEQCFKKVFENESGHVIKVLC